MAAVIVGFARTPFAKYMGAFATIPATTLGAHAIRAALERAGVSGDQVDRVLMGQVLQGGAGQGPARQAAVGGGVPLTVPAATINAAKKFAESGDFDKATAAATEAEALAKASIFQATSEKGLWKDMEIR